MAGGHAPGSFGALLQHCRATAGLTQQELAERAGLSRRGIADLERGARQMPYPDTVRRLAQALRLSEAEQARLMLAARRPNGHPPTQPRLPLPLTSFVGRERELVQLQDLLGTCRLLTLTGAGGVGKTRLALELVNAADVQAVALAELAPIGDPALVGQAVAAVLGVPEQPDRTWADVLLDALAPRQLLLVLDNCEHVAAACAELAERLLRTCPGLRILATSREALEVSGETTFRVPSLSLPDARVAPTPGRVARSEAVRLFVQRAAAAWPGFEVTESNAAAVAQICRRLDGIPLALELAAAGVRLLSVQQMCERLDDALGLLVWGNRTAVPRQKTLRATVEWSYGLLEPVEQHLFQRLSVFAGGWTLEAAEVVCADATLPGPDVLQLLRRLVDKSLVVGGPAADGRVRYALLEMLRQLAAERLSADETRRVRDRHLDWFAALAARSAAELGTAHQAESFDWFGRELDNLRAALDWATLAGRAGAGLRLAAAMRGFWFHGHQVEGRARLQALLGLPAASADPVAEALALTALGALTRERGDLTQARAYGQRAVELARACAEPATLFDALVTVGWTTAFQRDWDAAQSHFDAAQEVAERASPNEQAWAVFWQGQLAALRRDDAQARRLLELSVSRLRALGDGEHLAQGLCVLADIALRQGRLAAADAHAREALQIADGLGHVLAWTARSLDLLVRVAAAQRQFDRAVRLAAAVSSLHPRLGTLLSRMARQEVVDQAKQALGSAQAAAVWAEGEAMSRRAAVAYALSDAQVADAAAIACGG